MNLRRDAIKSYFQVLMIKFKVSVIILLKKWRNINVLVPDL